jgi:uncharacterized caspase-like protein
VVVAVLAAALLGVPPGASAQKPRAELPTYELGEQWFRSDGVFELTRVEPDRYVFTAPNGREVHLAKDLAPIKTFNNGYYVEIESPFQLKWPLEVGKWGAQTTRWKWHSFPQGGPTPSRMQWEVKAYEDVSVGGRAYKAFRVEWEVRHPGGKRAQQTLWYAPEARQWVKAEGERDLMPLWSWTVFDVPMQTPLAIALVSPASEERVTGDSASVTARIRGKTAVSDVRIAVNGVEVFSRQPGTREYSASEAVKLRHGKNVILVTATEKSGQTMQEARVVYADTAAASAPPAPSLALVTEPKPEPETPPAVAPPAAPPAPSSPPPARPEPRPSSPPIAARPVPRPPAAVPQPAPAAPPPAVAVPPQPAPPSPPVVATPPAAPAVAAPEPKPAPPAVVEPKPVPPPPVVAALPPPAPPLVVKLASPAERAKVENETVALAGVASGGRGISRVVVTVNGVEVHRRDEKVPARAVPLNLPLKLREGANTLVVSVTDADGAIEQEIRSVAYEKPVPFAIHFRYPEDRAKVSEQSSLVAAVVESSRGISLTRIIVNGSQVFEQAERATQRSMLVTAPVTLREGANAIVVAATQSDGAVRQEIRTVIYEAPKVAVVPPPPPPPAAVASDRWAVVIGVGAYESPGIPRLKYSVPDADAIYETLVGPAGFKKENVLLLTDRSERKPTLRNIKWALGTFLGRSAKKDDTVLIFYAGHGAPEVDTRGVERDGLAKYLIPADADPDDLYSTALPMDELQTIFARIESERVVAFLDACYSGAAGGRTFTAKRTRAGAVDDLFLERLTRSKGRAIVTASRPSEVSIELPELGHGIFTYYLVSGLKGAADLNRDGIVSLQELYEYVEQQVTGKSRAVGGNQHPVMKGELEGVLPLTKVGR